MQKESIVENCQRLQAFLKDDSSYKIEKIINDISPKGLLDAFGRILDYNGAPATGWSWLYLTGDDYLEMLNYCKEHLSDTFYDNNGKSFLFKYDGYQWYVNNK